MIPSFDRPAIMGIVNVTPDSFSGDGLLRKEDFVAAAIDQAANMLQDGATWLDIGGESTRPGAESVSEAEEIDRIAPVIGALHARWPHVPLSIDTSKPAVGLEAIEAGALLLNDVSGDAADPAMFALAAKTGAFLVLMHNAARPQAVAQDVQLGGCYDAAAAADIAETVTQSLAALAARAQKAGVQRDRLILDPGLGFGKTPGDNLKLIRDLNRLCMLGHPVLLGPSRKNFIGRVLDTPSADRTEGTAACVAIGVLNGASILRVHDVRPMTRTARMAFAIRKGCL